jgi:hypothetical protein
MYEAGFAGDVRIGFLVGEVNTVNRRDIDHLGGTGGSRGLAQCRRQGLRQKERRLGVQVENLVPAFLWKFIKLRAPCGAGVVHQNVHFGFVSHHRGSERFGARDGRDIHGN